MSTRIGWNDGLRLPGPHYVVSCHSFGMFPPVMSIMLLRNIYSVKVGICKFEQEVHLLLESNGRLCNLPWIIQLIMYRCPLFICQPLGTVLHCVF